MVTVSLRPYHKGLTLGALLLVAALLSAATLNAVAAPEPKWTVRTYADSDFCLADMTDRVMTASISCPLGKFRTTPGRWTRGRALVAHGLVDVGKAGCWTFRVAKGAKNNSAFRLMVGDRLCEGAETAVDLKAGAVPLRLFIREGASPARKPGTPFVDVTVEARAPDAADFAPVDVRTDGTLPAHDVAFDRGFGADEAFDRWYSYRSFRFEAGEDGFYEFRIQTPRPQQRLRLVLDDLQILSWQKRAGGTDDAYYGEPDTTGDRHLPRLDFFGCLRAVRYLTKGEHVIDLHSYEGVWIKGDQTVYGLRSGTVRLGVNRFDGRGIEGRNGFWLEGRDDAVFAVGEKLQLRGMSRETGPYAFEVRERGAAKPCHRETREIGPKGGSFGWDCPREGAYEYVVKDAAGATVDGPWSFVVVDDTPRQRPSGGAFRPMDVKVVDRVEASEPLGGPHDVRDNGTSRVATNWQGVVYREAGPAGCREKFMKRPEDKTSAEYKRGDLLVATAADMKGKSRWSFPSSATMDWFAFTLNVPEKGRPYVVRCAIPNDRERYVTVYAIDRKTGQYNAWKLHAGLGPASGPLSDLRFLVWPNDSKIDVMVLNDTGCSGGNLNRRGAIAAAELLACADGHLGELAVAAGGWSDARGFGWFGEQGDLYVNERTMPPLWDGDGMVPVGRDGHSYHSWRDMLVSWDRFGELAACRGDSVCFGPIYSYGMQLFQGPVSRICYPGKDVHGEGHYDEATDPFDRDQFKLILMKASRHNVKYAADFMIYPPTDFGVFWARALGRPAETNGFYLTADASGRPWRSWTSAYVCNPAHPVYRAVAVKFCEELARRYGRFPAFAGVRNRYWVRCEAGFEPWWRSADLGFDDFTVGLFAKENGLSFASVGTNQLAFAARRDDITNRFGAVWSRWRSDKVRTLKEEMLAAMRRHAPQAQFYVTDSLRWQDGAGLSPEVFRGRRELGYLEEQTRVTEEPTELGSLDGRTFANFNRRPAPYGNPDHGTNEWKIAGYPTGLCCNSGYPAHPYQLAKPARALAENRLKQLWAGGEWCLPPPDEGMRAFVRAYRAIPDLDYRRFAAAHGTSADAPYAVYSAQTDDGLVVWLANATDCDLSVTVSLDSRSAVVRDLVDGGRRLMAREFSFAVGPFMPSVWRVSGENAIRAVKVSLAGEAEKRVRAEVARVKSFGDDAERRGVREVWPSVLNTDQWLPKPDAFGGRDHAFAFAEAAAQVLAAEAADDTVAEYLALGDFRKRHGWWYQAYGWPREDQYCTAAGVQSVDWIRRTKYYILTNVREGAFVSCEPYDLQPTIRTPRRDPLFTLPRGKGLSVGFYSSPRPRYVKVTALFGGGYGDLRVAHNGKTVWTFPAGVSDHPRLETRVSSVPVVLSGPLRAYVDFIGEGPKGLALHGVRLEDQPSEPVTAFAADGRVFETGGRRLFRVSEAPSTNLTFWVRTNGGHARIGRCGGRELEVKADGKVVAKRTGKPDLGYSFMFVPVQKGRARIDLSIAPDAAPDALVGVSVDPAFVLETSPKGK